MSIAFRALIALSSLLVLLSTLPTSVDAASWSNEGRRPVFVGVDKVYIYVKYRSSLKEDELPAPLHRKNIESLLARMYTDRLTKERCGEPANAEKGCHVEPARILTVDEYVGYRSKDLLEERKKPGALNVVFHVRIRRATQPDDDPPAAEPLFAYYSEHEWPGRGPQGSRRDGPLAIYPVAQTPESIESNMTNYIKHRVDVGLGAIVDEL